MINWELSLKLIITDKAVKTNRANIHSQSASIKTIYIIDVQKRRVLIHSCVSRLFLFSLLLNYYQNTSRTSKAELSKLVSIWMKNKIRIHTDISNLSSTPTQRIPADFSPDFIKHCSIWSRLPVPRSICLNQAVDLQHRTTLEERSVLTRSRVSRSPITSAVLKSKWII